MLTMRRLLFLAFLSGPVIACDVENTPLVPDTPPPSNNQKQAYSPDNPLFEGTVHGVKPSAVVSVDLSVEGVPRPGAQLELTGEISVNMPIRNLDMRVWAPELEFAKHSGFGESYRILRDFTVPNLFETRVPGEL